MRCNRTIRCLTAALLWALPLCSWANEGIQISPARPYLPYTTTDGMTQAQATALAQDDTGYLWITTIRGLNRFDGREFDQLTISDGLRTNELTAIEALPGNTLLVGDADGYTYIIHDNRITATVAPPPETNGAVTDFAVDGTTVYLSIENAGLATFALRNPNQGARIALPARQAISDLAVHDRQLWFVMAEHLYFYSTDHGAEAVLDRVLASQFDSQGLHWLIRSDGVLGVFSGNARFLPHPITVDGEFYDLDVASDGTVWLLSDETLTAYDPTILSGNDSTQSYPNIDSALFLFVDRENLVWLSAESRLNRLLGNRFQHYDLRTGPASHNVWSIAEDSERRMYFGTHDTILRLDENDVLVDVGRASGIPSGHVRDLIADDNDIFWAAVRGVGLYRFDSNTVAARLVPGTEGLEILDLDLDASGQLWIGTFANGIFRFDTDSGELLRRPVPNDGAVYTLDADSEGNVWFGIDETALVKLAPTANGYDEVVYGENTAFAEISYTHVIAATPSTIWVGGLDGALYRFSNGVAENVGPGSPLRDQSAYTVEPLADGRLIVGGELGLYLIDPVTFSYTHFGTLEGFIALETNAHATFWDSEGFLWLGTINGATRMNVESPVKATGELIPNVVSIRSNGWQRAVTDGASIPWSGRDIALRFAAISLKSPRGIEYSYRLNGMHEDWLPPTSTRSLEFTGLAPGDYTFEVRARYEGETWSTNIASHSFRILKPFWLETWFVIAAIFSFAAALGGFMRLRTRRVLHANRRLREEVMARTKSIVDANNRLETSNMQLANEIAERRKADEARVEVESQMQLAFDNTPIGMGMIRQDRQLQGANPALRRLLWPDQNFSDNYPDFFTRLERASRREATSLLADLATGACDSGVLDADCTSSDGKELQTSLTLTAVRNPDTSLKYALLHIEDVTEARKLTSLLEVQANYDELTGLLNRRAFEVELTKICELPNVSESSDYLLFMDLDRFKLVNDTSGHSAGDALLKNVANIMRSKVRSNDTLGRLGGDEFGLILRGASKAAVTRIAEAIRLSIDEYRFHWEAETHRIGISIGVVMIDSDSVNELEQLADTACYSAKNEGRNCVYFVEADEQSVQKNRGEARWVQRLRSAMDNRQFALYGQIIQPLRRRKKKAPERIEVLLRMRDPATQKLIPPGAFLPAAERYGLSTELDQWVVSSLLDTLFVHEAFGAAEHCYWVNLSGASIGDKRFADFLVGAMRQSPLPPGMINFEITETAVIRNLSEARRLIVALRDMGCQFALDDFGSGLSSFGYLKKLPVDCVKIDGMFIRDILTDDTDRIFVKSIIDIAATMGIASVAEFVENNAILAMIRDLGADYAQGFGVHRPEMISPEFPGNALMPLGSEAAALTPLKEQRQ